MNESIQKLSKAGVRFIVIGGQAMRYLGMPRTTIDWDLFIPPRDEENLRMLNAALEDELDMPVLPLGPRGENFVQTFQTQWALIQFHQIVAGLPSFFEAEAASIVVDDQGIKLRRLSGAHLIAAKEKANRPTDQQDLAFLREMQKAGRLI